MFVFVAACGDALDITDPDIVTPENLDSPTGVATLVAGAKGDLALALDGTGAGHGSTPGIFHYNGTLSDEFNYTGTFPTRIEVDQRSIRENNSETGEAYFNLHRARAAAERAASAVQENLDPSEDSRFAEMKALEGFTYVAFGETFCSGVPFSRAAESGEIEFGQPQTTDEMFQGAVQRFDAALGQTAGSATAENLARVGKARALLDLAQFQEAGQVAGPVPTDFTYLMEHSGATLFQSNALHTLSTVRKQYSIADTKGGNGLPYRSANDPRVPWERTPGEVGQDDQSPYFNQLKYTSPDASTVLASGVEARLIEAEAALQGSGKGGAFETLHNDLRAREGLDPVETDTMSMQEATDFHFRERAFWMWATGHRLGDMRRLVRQYGRPADQVFAVGNYPKGGQYGADVTVPVPLEEQNNPNFESCLDTGA
jgi:hypothetical protein